MTWPEVDTAIQRGVCAVLPVGSVEQHGPMGLIGTDFICANAVALRAAERADAIVVPPIAYTPAPFNTAFPGTISIQRETLTDMVKQICKGLLDQGFIGVFILNGHGANLDPIRTAMNTLPEDCIKLRSWWDAPKVNSLRATLYGDWEGMHATPSEVAITQSLHGPRPPGDAATPPQKLSLEFIKTHAGDRHGPPDEHRRDFPDGRVGSHSALATVEDGEKLLDIAGQEFAKEIQAFSATCQNLRG